MGYKRDLNGILSDYQAGRIEYEWNMNGIIRSLKLLTHANTSKARGFHGLLKVRIPDIQDLPEEGRTHFLNNGLSSHIGLPEKYNASMGYSSFSPLKFEVYLTFRHTHMS